MADSSPRLADLLPAPLAPRRPRWLLPLVAGSALIALFGGAGAIWTLTRNDSVPATSPSPSITVSGVLTLTDLTGSTQLTDDTCVGDGGYDDLRAGTQVIVTDPGGITIGVGQLSSGRLNVQDVIGTRVLGYCVWTFTVVGVPAGHGFYGVEVSHRGRIQYSEADLARRLELTLG